jgi:hypothetical protein
MMSRRRWGVVGAVSVMAVVAIGASVTAAAQEDPTVEIGAVAVDQVRLSSPTASSSARQQQVEALERLDGTLTMLGDDPEDFYIGPIELEFGPEAWVMTAGPSEDFDGDGDLERLLNELRGLVGRPVTALVRLDNDGDEANVYRLNDLTFRDSAGGRPPWLAAEADDADAATWEAVRTAAADAVGPGAVVDELEWQSAGDVAWEVDVLSADGREHTVLLDSAAQVLDVRLGD